MRAKVRVPVHAHSPLRSAGNSAGSTLLADLPVCKILVAEM
jgi:hypothetical protein